MVRRHELTDEQWERIQDLLPGKAGDPGVTAQDNRGFVNGVLWIAKTGAQWRDLPERYGKWDTVYQRFRRWCLKGNWEAIFSSLAVEVDPESLMMDSTVIRAQVDAAGVKGGTRKPKRSDEAEGALAPKFTPSATLWAMRSGLS